MHKTAPAVRRMHPPTHVPGLTPTSVHCTYPAVLEARALEQLADLLVQAALLWYADEDVVGLQVRGGRRQHGGSGGLC